MTVGGGGGNITGPSMTLPNDYGNAEKTQAAKVSKQKEIILAY